MIIKNIATLGMSALFALTSTQLFAVEKDDATINREVKAKITTDTNIPTVEVPNIVVRTKDGKVMLTGTVNSSSQKKDAEKAAKSVEGVKKVDVEIEVTD